MCSGGSTLDIDYLIITLVRKCCFFPGTRLFEWNHTVTRNKVLENNVSKWYTGLYFLRLFTPRTFFHRTFLVPKFMTLFLNTSLENFFGCYRLQSIARAFSFLNRSEKILKPILSKHWITMISDLCPLWFSSKYINVYVSTSCLAYNLKLVINNNMHGMQLLTKYTFRKKMTGKYEILTSVFK